MAKRPRRNHSPSFKAKVAIAAIKGDKTLAELAHQILAWRDNVFVERLWRTVEYEEVYLRAYAGVAQARASIRRYLSFYNPRETPHCGADRARWWGWRRTRSESTRPACIADRVICRFGRSRRAGGCAGRW